MSIYRRGETTGPGPACYHYLFMETYIRVFSTIVQQIKRIMGLGLCPVVFQGPIFHSLAHKVP